MNKILLGLLSVFLISSCAIQKRKYQKGYYISWLGTKSANKEVNTKPSEKSKIKPVIVCASPELILVAATHQTNAKDNLIKKEEWLSPQSNTIAPPDSCDKMIFKNGNEEMVKVLEIGSDEISYKKCSMPDGPKYITRKSDVFSITFRNGTREVFPANSQTNYSSTRSNSGGYKNIPDNRDNEEAITSLVLGIAGLFLGFGSIPAIVTGFRALKNIRAYPNKYKGETLAQLGIGLGVFKIAIIFLLILLIILTI